MFSEVPVAVQELLAQLGVSTELLITVLAVTVVLSTSILTGQAARVGIWVEDLMYRFSRSGG